MLEKYLLEKWKEITGETLPEALDIVPVTTCMEDYGNDLVFIFVDHQEAPSYVIKVARDSRFNFKLKKEYASLSIVNESPLLKKYVPDSLYSDTIGKKFFFIQKAVAGKSLSSLIHMHGLNAKNRDLIKKSVLLLCQINILLEEASPVRELPGEMKHQDIIPPFQDELLQKRIPSEKVKDLLSARSLFVAEKRNFFLHGDYWQSNIFVGEKNKDISGIIDWEFSTVKSVLPCDIIWFLINLAICMFRHKKSSGTMIDAFEWGFFTSGEHNDFITSCFRLYMEKIGMDQKLFSPLLCLSLVEMAMREKLSYGCHTDVDMVCLDMLLLAMDQNNL